MGARIVFLGDDFTGASDSLATYARGGFTARLVTGEAAPQQGLDVLGIATDLRSLPPERAVQVVERLWPVIAREAPQVLHLKTCSTFDSAPHIGSIGAVAQQLIERFKPDVTAVIGGQPSLGRYCAFGTLFARGPDSAVHRIDRHPVMSCHPVTPMQEADLGLHLAAQGLGPLTRITVPDLQDPRAVATRLTDGPALIDVMRPDDLGKIREALKLAGGRQLLIGASSVAEIHSTGQGIVAPSAPPAPPGAVLSFAGSRSAVTAAQVKAARSYKRVRLAPEMLDDPAAPRALADSLKTGQPLLLHLDPDASYHRSPDALADACAELVESIAAQHPLRALGLAGGDTSSRIVARLGFTALDYLTDMGQGACICSASHADGKRNGMRVLLKGGQMGSTDLFDEFAEHISR
ncbi:four-carbon acid sugar kinase family protein [Vannielia litorea]|uniref:four-carbon acid sugar kinase family protein n=1 Tax=Vannielia litorea TaxID=1217970 RepID=UPI001C9533ED|nr:four-carbon acid sugar kinase family protein [Vannielia litorea]MBY6049758.1 four-carbon acid sugar kinase family protein [Vannielia litorea]MBY6077172.1 four-carbon acid sugar kinase family protein [Vannielia litorea]